jgi:phage tail tape-measure protein
MTTALDILINARNNASPALKTARGHVTDLGSAAKSTSGNLTTMGVALGTMLGNLASAGLSKLSDMVSNIVSTGVQFNNMGQQAQIAFSTMLGSGQEAEAFLNRLKDFAAKTPFEFPDLLTASQRMLAMGFQSDKVLPTLTAIGDAVAGLGGSSAMVDRVTTALGQMRAKGKASGEEMM